MSWFQRLRTSLGKARGTFAAVQNLGRERKPLTDEFWDELEEVLILGDFGVPTTTKIVEGLRTVAKQEAWKTTDQPVERFHKDVERFLTLPHPELAHQHRPTVVLVVGVNGTGKTTTIGKLAARLRAERKSVLMVAADTFRAAAAEQLGIWAQRSESGIVRGEQGADPASVVFDGVQAGKARNVDYILIDTAGRLQTKSNLMDELKKIRRVIERELGRAPDETLLVVDGTTGQNAISQAKLFHDATQLSGLVVTKLDSTAKGGVLVAIVDELEIPVKFIGIGEGVEDLRPFEAAEFTRALFDDAA